MILDYENRKDDKANRPQADNATPNQPKRLQAKLDVFTYQNQSKQPSPAFSAFPKHENPQHYGVNILLILLVGMATQFLERCQLGPRVTSNKKSQLRQLGFSLAWLKSLG